MIEGCLRWILVDSGGFWRPSAFANPEGRVIEVDRYLFVKSNEGGGREGGGGGGEEEEEVEVFAHG